MFVSASLKDRALLCSSLRERVGGMLLWCILESSAESSGCRTPAQCPPWIICKAGTRHTCAQMFCSLFPHEDSRQYARKLSISDGEITPKGHSDCLWQSRRDRFSWEIRWVWPAFFRASACYCNTNPAQCLWVSDKRPLCWTFVPSMKQGHFSW